MQRQIKRYALPDIEKAAARLLTSKGAPASDAEIVVKSLARASARGIHSHGIALIRRYLSELAEGVIRPEAAPVINVERTTPLLTASIDGYKGFGQIGVHRLCSMALQRLDCGIDITVAKISRSNHIGDLKQYAALFNRVGFSFFGVANAGPNVGLKDGKKVGTNPICISVPVEIGRTEYFGCDTATSVFPEGKVRFLQMDQKKVPKGVLRDKHGLQSKDPKDLYNGGWLEPIGGHKGFSLASAIDLFLASLGASSAAQGWEYGNNAFFLAIRSQDTLNQSIPELGKIIDHYGDDMPGLAELRAEKDAEENGVALDKETIDTLGL